MPGQQGSGNRLKLQGTGIAAVAHRHVRQSPLDHLHDEAAEELRQVHVRFNFAQHLGVEGIDIHRVANGARL